VIVDFSILVHNGGDMEAEPRSPLAPRSDTPDQTSVEFAERLQVALARKGEALGKSELPRLKETLRVFHLTFKTLYDVLLKKGLLHEDPYKHDQKISEITIPSNSPFLESERDTQMSVRLSEFESQLDFLNHFYQFSLEFLDLRRIKNLVALTSYFRWSQLSPTSDQTTTRVLAELLEKITKGGDPLSSGIVGDAHAQLAKLQKNILADLKTVADFQRETYKLRLRVMILPGLTLPSAPAARMDDSIRSIKKQFGHAISDEAFYPELAQEVIQEEYAPNAEQRRAEMLKRLSVEEQKQKKVEPDDELRRILTEAIRALAVTNRSIEEALTKLQDNSTLLESRHLSFGERLRRWALRALGRKERKETYEVRYNDITTSAVQRETLEFREFCRDAERKARLYAGITTRTGAISKRIEGAAEDQLFSFLSRNITEAQLLYRRLQSLDAFFKETLPEPDRQQLRGIKTELTAMKNNIIKANRQKHEYAARKEESDQFKKLGLGESTETPL